MHRLRRAVPCTRRCGEKFLKWAVEKAKMPNLRPVNLVRLVSE